MKKKITIDGKTREVTLRDEAHLFQVITNKSSISKNKKKTIERRSKYKNNYQGE